MEPNSIRLFFDGYCPESLIQGKRVEMRLNEDDFWESLETGLQITAFPPYAVLLRWRGEGKFRESSGFASDECTGLVMTESSLEEGKEMLPSEELFGIIGNNKDLRIYLNDIYPNKAAYDAENTFNWNDPAFKEQEQKLRVLPQNVFQEMAELFDAIDPMKRLREDEAFEQLHERLYQHKIIFNYNWMSWQEGQIALDKGNVDFPNCTLLKLTMYLTVIFRGDRFSDGTILKFYQNGTLQRIIHALLSAWEKEKVYALKSINP